MTSKSKIEALEARIEREKQELALARAREESAQRNYDQSLEVLKVDFGVSSVGEAEQLLEKLQNQLTSLIAETEEALESSQ